MSQSPPPVTPFSLLLLLPSLPPQHPPPLSTAILSSHLPEISEHFSFTKFSLKESPSSSNRTQSVLRLLQTVSRYPVRYWQVRRIKLRTAPRETGSGIAESSGCGEETFDAAKWRNERLLTKNRHLARRVSARAALTAGFCCTHLSRY